LEFVDSFDELRASDLYIISLRLASSIFDDFRKFMHDNPQSKFLFLEEYKRTLTDEDFDIREEPNTDIRMFTPRAALRVFSNLLGSADQDSTLFYQRYSWRDQ
jgi:hypothetical protein